MGTSGTARRWWAGLLATAVAVPLVAVGVTAPAGAVPRKEIAVVLRTWEVYGPQAGNCGYGGGSWGSDAYYDPSLPRTCGSFRYIDFIDPDGVHWRQLYQHVSGLSYTNLGWSDPGPPAGVPPEKVKTPDPPRPQGATPSTPAEFSGAIRGTWRVKPLNLNGTWYVRTSMTVVDGGHAHLVGRDQDACDWKVGNPVYRNLKGSGPTWTGERYLGPCTSGAAAWKPVTVTVDADGTVLTETVAGQQPLTWIRAGDACGVPQVPAPSARVTSESAQRRVTTVHLGAQVAEEAPDLTAELTEAGREFGFGVSTMPKSPEVWVEDLGVMRTDGTLLAPNRGPYLQEADADTKKAYPQRFVRRTGQLTPDMIRDAYANSVTVRESTVHLDGGNVLAASRADGTPVVLVARGALHYSAALRARKGCLPTGGSPAQRLADVTDIVAAELGVTPAQVVPVDQPRIHVDRFLRPGPAGKVFILDPDVANAVLDTFIADPSVPAGTRDRMKRMRFEGTDLTTMRTTMATVAGQLRAAGLTPVGVPGLYDLRRSATDRVADVNFLNAVTGTAPDGTVYHLTNQTDTVDGARALKPLEDAFATLLAEHGVTVRFMPTHGLVRGIGGIDCATLERTTANG